jgi:hypothetical protein
MFSMRLNRDMKAVLEDIAREERRSLSSLVENILADYLTERNIEWEHRERRGDSRKVVDIPARFQVTGHQITEAHDVYLKDLSREGAYIISTDVAGIENILKNEGVHVKGKIIIHIPRKTEPLVLDCQVTRISMNRTLAGIGLEYKDIRTHERSIIDEALLA